MYWQTRLKRIPLDRPLVMAILNVTPDSFSDGGQFATPEATLRQAEKLIEEGADIIDVGGESTRPGSEAITADVEIRRVAPVIAAIKSRFDTPISVDTYKRTVAAAAVDAGAEIINDISGLRFEPELAEVASGTGAGLVLMHSRGSFGTMHSQPPVADIIEEVSADFRRSIKAAADAGVARENIVLDIGIGFGKTVDQNLELIAELGKLRAEFADHTFLVGASRKSFLGKILGDAPPDRRLHGSLSAAAIAVWNGANIVRVHDVKETVETLAIVSAIRNQL